MHRVIIPYIYGIWYMFVYVCFVMENSLQSLLVHEVSLFVGSLKARIKHDRLAF